jgi:predicted anti-sigma-YlaC factor YlaD
MRCREVEKLIQDMPKGGCEETLRLISDHLTECQACRDLLAVSQKAEEVFAARKVVLDEIAERDPVSRDPLLSGIEQQLARRAWRPRVAWAGAAAAVSLLLAVAAIFYFGGNGQRPPAPTSPRTPSTPVTRAMAEKAASSVLEKLAEVEVRYEAPPPRLLAGPPEVPWQFPRSRLYEQCSLASARTLVRIAESQTNLIWRNGS